MFFHLSINHYAPVLIRFWFGFGAGKKGGLYYSTVVAFLSRPSVMFGVVKVCLGFVIEFGLGVYSLLILIIGRHIGPPC